MKFLNLGFRVSSAVLAGTVLGLGQAHGSLQLVTTIPGKPMGVTVAGEYLYLADNIQGDGLRIFNSSDPLQPIHVYGDGRSSCAGVAVHDNRAYAMNIRSRCTSPNDLLRILRTCPAAPARQIHGAPKQDRNCM